MDYLDSFGNWLHQRREAFCLTRLEPANCADFSVLALQKLKAYGRHPSRKLVELLAECYPS